MSCVLLLRSGVKDTAEEAMQYYDDTRVWNRRGLTVVSQRKAVHFYETLWRRYWNIPGSLKDIPAEKVVGETFPIPVEPSIRIVGIQLLFLPNEEMLQLKIFKCVFSSTFAPACLF